MRLVRLLTNETIVLREPPLGAGGEARVYAVPEFPLLAAKIYHQPAEMQARKLRAMLAAPPEDPAAASGSPSISIAWPVDLLRDNTRQGGRIIGFLMPRVSGQSPIFSFYNPSTRRQQFPLSNAAYLHRTARNLCAAVRALHAKGYVIGDVNESNILVTQTALVTLVDTDSFQVTDAATGEIFCCPVGKLEFTPPELQGQTFLEMNRLPEHDHFGLAVLIFQLLMEGTHPFAGIYTDAGEPPPYESRIAAGHFPHGTKAVPYRPMPSAPPFAMLHPGLRNLFLRCFEAGHSDPKARPNAAEWRDALADAENDLKPCAVNSQHRFAAHNPACVWCERTRRLGGRDPFPSPSAVRQGQHLLRAPKRNPVPVEMRANTYNLPVPQRPAVSASVPFGASSGGFSAAYSGPSPSVTLPAVNAAQWKMMGRIAGVTGAAIVMALLILSSALRPAPGVLPTAGLGVVSLAFSPDGKTLAAGTKRADYGSSEGGEAILWDVTGEQEIGTAGRRHLGDVTALSFNADGTMLAAASWGAQEPGDVAVWDTRRRQMRWQTMAHESRIQAAVFSPDGSLLATGGAREFVRTKEIYAEIKLWDAGTGALIQSMSGAGEVFALAFSPDGKRIAAACGSSGNGSSFRAGAEGRVEVWEVSSARQIWSKPAHAASALAAAWLPDGKTLASAGSDNAIRLWNADTGHVLRTIETDSYPINALAVSPDGKTFASGGSDPAVTLWNGENGTKIRVLTGHKAAIRALAFSPDGRTLASGSLDGDVRLWRLE